MNYRKLFFEHVGQTSPKPLAMHIAKATGAYLWDTNGKQYIDLIAGISVANIGHNNKQVNKAIKKQLDSYLHVMVYGELIETPQVAYATALTAHLPKNLQAVYFTTGGSEATEVAMKLAKRVTKRQQFISFKNSYHGSTQGALSLMASEYWQQPFRPLLPGMNYLNYNNDADLEFISDKIAAVFVEPIQAESGVTIPTKKWLKALRKKCTENSVLLIADEIQTGFGRTGSMFAFQQLGFVPDVLLLGKALGGGMPLGGVVASKKLLDVFTNNPVLGHINTFGGHPLSCVAGLAAFKQLLHQNSKIVQQVNTKANLFRKYLQHPKIKALQVAGLLIAVHFENERINQFVIEYCLKQGTFTDWFLFAPEALRIAPPLIITEQQIKKSCATIIRALNTIN